MDDLERWVELTLGERDLRARVQARHVAAMTRLAAAQSSQEAWDAYKAADASGGCASYGDGHEAATEAAGVQYGISLRIVRLEGADAHRQQAELLGVGE